MSTKTNELNWRIDVPNSLKQGAHFDRWDEETGIIESQCLLRVDECGFYIYWLTTGKDTQLLDLCYVSEIRKGGYPRESRFQYELTERWGTTEEAIIDKSLTIVSGSDFVNLTFTHFVAQDVKTAIVWYEELQKVLHNFKMYHICPTTGLLKYWTMLCIGVNERWKIPIKNIIKPFAVDKNDKNVIQCLSELGLKVDEVEPTDFTFDKFYELYMKLCVRSEVQDLYNQLANGGEALTFDQLTTFINMDQRDPRLNEILFPHADKNRVAQLMSKHERHQTCLEKETVCFNGFLRYLMSDDNAPMFFNRIELYQPMDQPLCHYFINSSHNTYLTGRQFGGTSSVEAYRQTLLAGCRCIELDCWNGSGEDQDEIIITHGKAMCTDILFKDVILAIKETAFVTSDYPVILSFENHCNKSRQYLMARYCMDILGDLLLTKCLDDFPLESGVALPSPAHLKRKILIKNKRLNPDDERRQLEKLYQGQFEEDQDELNETSELGNEDERQERSTLSNYRTCNSVGTPPVDFEPAADWSASSMRYNASSWRQSAACTDSLTSGGSSTGPGESKRSIDEAHPESIEIPSGKVKGKSTKKLYTKEVASNPEELSRAVEAYKYIAATTKVHPLLSNIVNYMQPIKFQDFTTSKRMDCRFHISSFSENTAINFFKDGGIDLADYTTRQLCRIYPRGGRVDSSNFLPQLYWNVGIQMAALNFQTPDVSMQLNQGRFEYNGRCGYILKPECMRRPDKQFNPCSEAPVDGVVAAYCSIKIISGQFLSDKKIGTYVEVETYGLASDTIRKEFKTKIVPANGVNPIYNEEPFVFRKIVLPDLAVFRIAVYDENGKLIGQRILPLDGLQTGYRHVSLRTESSLPLTLPTIFCHIVLRTYVPKAFEGFVESLTNPQSHAEKLKRQLEQMGVSKEDIEEAAQISPSDLIPTSSSSISVQKILPVTSQHRLLAMATSNKLTGSSTTALPSTDSDSPGPVSQSSATMSSLFLSSAVDLDDLKKDKSFVKLLKKQQQDIEKFEKLFNKKQNALGKQQCNIIEKLLSSNRKKQRASPARGLKSNDVSDIANSPEVSSFDNKDDIERQIIVANTHSSLTTRPSLSPSTYSSSSASRTLSCSNTPTADHRDCNDEHSSAVTEMIRQMDLCPTFNVSSRVIMDDPTMKYEIEKQTQMWTDVERQRLEKRYEIQRKHTAERCDKLWRLFDDAQRKQMEILKSQCDCEKKLLESQQVKRSMDDAKSISGDRSIISDSERKRRLREKREKNIKDFLDERKQIDRKFTRTVQDLEAAQAKERDDYKKRFDEEIQAEKDAYLDSLLAAAAKKRTFV